MDKRLFRVQDVADQLAVSRAYVYELIAEKQLRATRLGRAVRIAPEDLEAFIARKRKESSKPAATA